MKTPKDKLTSRLNLPVEFVSPFSLDECRARLEAIEGRYQAIALKVKFSNVESNCFRFFIVGERSQLGYSRYKTKLETKGYIQQTSGELTRVVIQRVRWIDQWYSNIRVIYALCAYVILAGIGEVILQLLHYFMAVQCIVGFTVLGGTLGALFLFDLIWQNVIGHKEIIGLIQQVLSYPTEGALNSTSLMERLIALFGETNAGRKSP